MIDHTKPPSWTYNELSSLMEGLSRRAFPDYSHFRRVYEAYPDTILLGGPGDTPEHLKAYLKVNDSVCVYDIVLEGDYFGWLYLPLIGAPLKIYDLGISEDARAILKWRLSVGK